MSGTSLDGMDIAYCRFRYDNCSGWQYELLQACTIPYSRQWKQRLSGLLSATAEQYALTHVEYGHLIGQNIRHFIQENNLKVDFVASHGHTVFHQPERYFTAQIGEGAAIAAECNMPVISDFRTMDVACGGQGAPLVPIGDKLLFGKYDYCLNIGGITNISYDNDGERIAFDVSPANMVMNYFAEKTGKLYDKDGLMAKKGMLNQDMFQALNALSYYRQAFPKSLGREWFEQCFLPIVLKYDDSIENILHTICHHIAYQLAQIVNKGSMLITGGGAKNKYLISLFKQYMPNVNMIIPDNMLIEYKEALVFAFLGVLRMQSKVNCLKSVTGAAKNVVGGAVYYNTKPAL